MIQGTTFWNFWFWIILNVCMILCTVGYMIWYFYFDTRLRLFNFYPHKQVELLRRKIKDNETVDIHENDSNPDNNKSYTVNRDFLFYMGRVPFGFYWNNIPININMIEQAKTHNLSKQEIRIFKRLLNKINSPIQIDIHKPTTELRKNIHIDTAETFFRILHTNLTLNLLIPPTNFKKALKWGGIFIVLAIIVAVILHFTGVINLQQILGMTPK